MTWIHTNGLTLTYQTRKIKFDTPWYKRIFQGDYEKRTVLKDVNLFIDKPGVTAILGRNGTGKTTLIKTLTGILNPSHGNVQVLGYRPFDHKKDFLRQIGVIFGQKKMLWPELSLNENFQLTRAVYKLSNEDFLRQKEKLVTYFKLEKLLDRPVKTCSLGESMKAELANVFLFSPRLIFLDEPTVGLDIVSQKSLRSMIKDYVQTNECHVLMTSHNLKDIVGLAQEIYFLDQGTLKIHKNLTLNHFDLERALEDKLTQE